MKTIQVKQAILIRLLAAALFILSGCVIRPEPGARLAQPSAEELVRISKAVAGLTYRNGGATYNLYDGSLAGQSLYAVAVYPDRQQEVEGFPGPGIIHEFINRNMDLLASSSGLHLGTWVNQSLGRSYVDVAAAMPDLAEAKALGRKYGQESVYDLKNGTDIPVE